MRPRGADRCRHRCISPQPVAATKTCCSPTGTATEFVLIPMWVLMVPDFAISAAVASFPESMAKPRKTAHTRPLCRCIKLIFLRSLYFPGNGPGPPAPARRGGLAHMLVCFIGYSPSHLWFWKEELTFLLACRRRRPETPDAPASNRRLGRTAAPISLPPRRFEILP
jgi:hypothetical protein